MELVSSGARLTWRHVECATTSEITRVSFRSRQAEIRQINVLSITTTQYILRFQIPMIDAHVVAMLHSADDLGEDALDEVVIADILWRFRVKSVPKEIVRRRNLRAVFRLSS